MRLLFVLLFAATALGQASGAAPTPTGEYAQAYALAQGLGPYGAMLVMALLLSRAKLPSVPLRLEGPIKIEVAGPVVLSGCIDCSEKGR